MKKCIHFLFVVIPGILVGFVLIGSFLGSWHPLGDSLAVIRIPVAVLGLPLLLRPKAWRKLLWVPCLSVFVLGVHALDRAADTGDTGPYKIYQKNILASNRQTATLAQDILESGADFVTLQEVSSIHKDLLSQLAATYPHQHVCAFSGWSGIAVLSRFPFTPNSQNCSKWRGFAAAQVVTLDGPVWVVGLHLFWPYPKEQAQQVDRIAPMLADLKGPIILGGDFNMQPGTRVQGVIKNATRTNALRPAFTTFHVGQPRVPVSIDQVLAQCGTVERRPKLGSDHHGLLARVGVTPAQCSK